jgi:hypothetical protein
MNDPIPYSKIVPDDLQNALIAIEGANTLNSWRIGDITALVFTHCQENRIQAAADAVYSAVAAFCGKKSRTIREYHHLSGFYPLEIREAYGMLAYAHFRVAARLPDCRVALEWAVAQTDALGRPATVDSLEAHFAPQQDPTPPESPNWENDDTPPEDQCAGYNAPVARVARINNYLAAIRRELADFTEEEREDIQTSLDTLESTLAIARERIENSVLTGR